MRRAPTSNWQFKFRGYLFCTSTHALTAFRRRLVPRETGLHTRHSEWRITDAVVGVRLHAGAQVVDLTFVAVAEDARVRGGGRGSGAVSVARHTASDGHQCARQRARGQPSRTVLTHTRHLRCRVSESLCSTLDSGNACRREAGLQDLILTGAWRVHICGRTTQPQQGTANRHAHPWCLHCCPAAMNWRLKSLIVRKSACRHTTTHRTSGAIGRSAETFQIRVVSTVTASRGGCVGAKGTKYASKSKHRVQTV